ncbi:hypothetical protein EDD37DRAFT_678968 [Exophiala viscosa]|uniref:Dihydrodipicolinate synthase n=1 Tax=Exophiala viscosa TaxID=2486360 RepID=A0AAN6DU70_9EURO|nr:hypothetical protein EDD36DRAFT_487830 [Exophiala viscosa]KAI1625820.1 hypothetical protein EDD37DRAFT_678968 [Exophiala viscosa]
MGSYEDSRSKAFPPGIHAPSVTFFEDDAKQDIDWTTQENHLEFLVKSGVHGIVIAGSSGEAATLTMDERSQLVSRTRSIAKAQGKDKFPVTIGCIAGCTRDIMSQITAGHRSGADYALVLVPSIFHWAMTKKAVVAFFQEVADRSPVPILIYNFPNLLSGLDVDSDMLAELGSHPNICGVKLTCGGIAKVTRIAEQFRPQEFVALSGMSDWIVPALSVGGAGCISGLANLFPKTLVAIYELYTTGKVAEATVLQKQLGLPEWGVGTSGVNGMKWIIVKRRGYPETSAHCRRPFPRFVDAEKQERVMKLTAPMVPIEKELTTRK